MTPDRVPVKLVFPKSLYPHAISDVVWMHRVPVAGDIVDLAEGPGGDDFIAWGSEVAGKSFAVQSVVFTVLKPADGNPPPPQVILGD